MGHFSQTCFASHLGIKGGQRVLLFPIVNTTFIPSDPTFFPIMLPIRATYDDYGSVDFDQPEDLEELRALVLLKDEGQRPPSGCHLHKTLANDSFSKKTAYINPRCMARRSLGLPDEMLVEFAYVREDVWEKFLESHEEEIESCVQDIEAYMEEAREEVSTRYNEEHARRIEEMGDIHPLNLSYGDQIYLSKNQSYLYPYLRRKTWDARRLAEFCVFYIWMEQYRITWSTTKHTQDPDHQAIAEWTRMIADMAEEELRQWVEDCEG